MESARPPQLVPHLHVHICLVRQSAILNHHRLCYNRKTINKVVWSRKLRYDCKVQCIIHLIPQHIANGRITILILFTKENTMYILSATFNLVECLCIKLIPVITFLIAAMNRHPFTSLSFFASCFEKLESLSFSPFPPYWRTQRKLYLWLFQGTNTLRLLPKMRTRPFHA